MLNFNQLRIFYYAAKHQNFSEAARRIFITQPAVTVQVKALEEFCDLKLFRKKGRKVVLTGEGQTLYDYAKKIFEFENEIEAVIEEMRELKRGELRLGTTKTYARYLMPFMITSFRQKYPRIRIKLYEGSSRDVTQSLLDFTVELGIIAKAVDHPEVRFEPFSQEELVLIAAPTHPIAAKPSISVRELAEVPILLKETGSGTRKIIDSLFKRHGCTPNILMETSSTEFIKQEVQHGDGVSFLVKPAIAHEVRQAQLVIVPLADDRVQLDVSIASLNNQYFSPPAKAFLNILERMAPKDMPFQSIAALVARGITDIQEREIRI